MRKEPLMKCGHTAQGHDQNGNPVCVICIGLNEGATIIDEQLPIIKGRIAKCSYCVNTRLSSFNLPFFEHKSNQKQDKYYCGCLGWD